MWYVFRNYNLPFSKPVLKDIEWVYICLVKKWLIDIFLDWILGIVYRRNIVIGKVGLTVVERVRKIFKNKKGIIILIIKKSDIKRTEKHSIFIETRDQQQQEEKNKNKKKKNAFPWELFEM